MTAGDAGYEYFDVEADVGIRAWGATRAEAFAQSALGVFALLVALEGVAERETREVRAQAETPEELVVNWINACLYVHEIEAFAARRVTVSVVSDTLVHGVLHGEEIDPRRHRLGTVVKAATMHRVEVREEPGRSEVRLIVDV